jgi:RND family efflux transporter MFP subunit
MKRLRAAITACLIAGTTAFPQISFAQTSIVKIEKVEATGSGLSRVFFVHVVAREPVDLAFQVAGQIVEFPLDEGADVAKGELVARLDLVPFELALEEARANNDQASRTLERYRQLEGSAVSQTSVQDAETQVDLANIALRNAERALEQATLHAPFDALVASRLLPNFSTTAAGNPVVRLHDMSDLRIEIEVPETLFQQAGLNPDVEIFAEFTGNPKKYPLQMREINAETATVGQTYSITLGMEPTDELNVWPGSSARVTVTSLEGSDDNVCDQLYTRVQRRTKRTIDRPAHPQQVHAEAALQALACLNYPHLGSQHTFFCGNVHYPAQDILSYLHTSLVYTAVALLHTS